MLGNGDEEYVEKGDQGWLLGSKKLTKNKILPEMIGNGKKIGQITFLAPFLFSLQIQGSRFTLADLSGTICSTANAFKGYTNF